MTSWAVGVQSHPPVSEGQVQLHAPRTPDSSEDQASEGRAIKPAPQRRAGAIARPFWRGGGVGGREGGGRALINAPLLVRGTTSPAQEGILLANKVVQQFPESLRSRAPGI
ncbi:hypothetical protein PGTUg99_028875 [Puccinia graminis f. sp. tritici]|uniref:Uncharacterized protein n=1 Tax=Puccinia graminis f. sp. tritici TaxID=56615 RepID=A0A5B0LWP2_PUCGR|nr:hypothetical protein PGTUg99_028875 [Puccinia graminis f. sp. tritici]